MDYDFSTALVFAAVAVFFILAALTVGRLVRPARPSPAKGAPYECGEEAIGSSRIRFQSRFFTVALVFLIFAAEVAVLYPWVTVFREEGQGLSAFLEIVLFLAFLAAGFAYVWVRGDLEWIRGTPGNETIPRSDRP